jgi:hypothetical protein
MSSTADLITRHWAQANARDWAAFASTLHPGIEYRVPQTRELIRGIDALVAFYATYPGSWTMAITRLVADGDSAVTTTAFHVEQHTLTGIAFFTLKDGLIWRIEDWWPEDYSPPTRQVAVERY